MGLGIKLGVGGSWVGKLEDDIKRKKEDIMTKRYRYRYRTITMDHMPSEVNTNDVVQGATE